MVEKPGQWRDMEKRLGEFEEEAIDKIAFDERVDISGCGSKADKISLVVEKRREKAKKLEAEAKAGKASPWRFSFKEWEPKPKRRRANAGRSKRRIRKAQSGVR